ncbi:MAG: bacteriochlorophyll 4-vinyl reductase [Gammaproteobacteria bacterium]|jgi:divinyl protochlorophyllide a 8-vinyl-reductase
MVSIPVTRQPPAAHSAATTEAMIGPNAVLQTLRAAAELEGIEYYATLAGRAYLPATDLESMIPEAWFVRLVEALRATLPWPRSEAVLRRAGEYTADYVAENRIPALFRQALHVLPPRLAVPLLLTAFRRHAWTFAGAGRFSAEGRYPGCIVLSGGPTCRHAPHNEQAGAYYEAAFQGLLRLAAPRITVREVACQARGDAECRFALQTEGVTARGENPCVSS